MPSRANVQLARTCQRYYESCLWNSTILLIMLARLRTIKAWATVVPIVIGTTPGLTTLAKLIAAQSVTRLDIILSVTSFVSGMTPLIYNALKLDDHIERLKSLSAEYVNLRDRFRTAAEVSINKTIREFEEDIEPLIERLELAREVGVTTPDWAYMKAKLKIDAGHYSFEVDQPTADSQATLQVDTDSVQGGPTGTPPPPSGDSTTQ